MFSVFLQDEYNKKYPKSSKERTRLLQNMNLATAEGFLNLAGVLLFAKRPELIAPHAVVNAVRYCGNTAYSESATDTRTFARPLCGIFDDALAFIMSYLHKVQAGRGVNAPIRLLIFENRIEIISPGHLPDNLTLKTITAGNFSIRNPTLASYAAKGILPYRGLGSGINRALKSWPDIEFLSDCEGRLFTVVVRRANVTGRGDWVNAS
ncbi:MAG: hypothetical protein LBC94_02805 [Desulfovibrio sp.]|nr:hypothetical protein [Desulfovibrio sp.]